MRRGERARGAGEARGSAERGAAVEAAVALGQTHVSSPAAGRRPRVARVSLPPRLSLGAFPCFRKPFQNAS